MTNQKTVEENLPPIKFEDFVLWQENLVTRHILAHFREVLEYTKEARLNRELIQTQEGIYRANELMGYCHAIEEVLDFTIEEEKDDEGKSAITSYFG